ncbi:MAG: hypothetical protein JSV03_14305 [Planctomycetota bacterium]|nr:MAG: hypothetical protein JSV03_14305 [Planctomycetota bacterium]
MYLDDGQCRMVSDFRSWLESAVSDLLQGADFNRYDRGDDSILITRWPAEAHFWYEVSIRPFLPQVRIGIMTDDRFRSEDFERLITDSGDTMQEFVEEAFGSVGLYWSAPPVEHYCEDGLRYYFSTPMDLKCVDQLSDKSCRDKAFKVFRGYDRAFFQMSR